LKACVVLTSKIWSLFDFENDCSGNRGKVFCNLFADFLFIGLHCYGGWNVFPVYSSKYWPHFFIFTLFSTFVLFRFYHLQKWMLQFHIILIQSLDFYPLHPILLFLQALHKTFLRYSGLCGVFVKADASRNYSMTFHSCQPYQTWVL